jgi:hypothetical protein
VNRTPCRRNHALCSGYATQNQERRALVRRGRRWATVAVYTDGCLAKYDCRIKSGACQPAVGMSNAIAIADAFVRRPASAACRSETTFATGNALDFRVSGSHTENIPRGAYAPRSWCSADVCRRKTTFAMHERTCTRAAGVSPPWVCTRWSVAHGVRQITCKRASETTAGLRQPLLGAGRVFAA